MPLIPAARLALAGLAVAGLAAAGLPVGAGLSPAAAQTYTNPDLPRSPYPLPAPTYRGAPEDEGDVLLFGNGQLHSSGQWRHWGDSRNSGETFKDLFAPSGVLGPEVGPPNDLPVSRYCALHPRAC